MPQLFESFLSEKFMAGRSGALAAAWDHAAARAPWTNLVAEWIQLTVAIRSILRDPEYSRQSLEKRLAFLKWDLESRLGEQARGLKGASGLDRIIKVLFDDLNFGPVSSSLADPDFSLLDTVLSYRKGSPTSVSVLFAWTVEALESSVAEKTRRLAVEFVKNAPPQVVRVRTRGAVNAIDVNAIDANTIDANTIDANAVETVGSVLIDEKTEYISSEDGGRKVAQTDWMSWCKEGSALEKLTVSDVWIRLLLELRNALEIPSSRWPELNAAKAQVLIVDQLIAFRPSQIRLFAERAMLRHRLGNTAGALDDLKRFFAFQDRKSAAPAIVELYDSLKGGPEPLG